MDKKVRAKELAMQAQSFGVPAEGYARGPFGKDVFSLAIRENKVRIWPGLAEVTLIGSKARKQIVLNVVEKARTVKYVVKGSQWWDGTPPKDYVFRDRFPVRFPDDDLVTWTIENVRKIDEHWVADVTAKVKATKASFLVGTDESHLFVSMLPKQAKSVADAHRILRPKGVDGKAKRQGEYFFQPVTKTEAARLDKRIEETPDLLDNMDPLLDEEGDESTHYAAILTDHGRDYTRGYVTDREFGRAVGWRSRRSQMRKRHHKPLFLATWHRVIHNTELTPPAAVAGGSVSWD